VYFSDPPADGKSRRKREGQMRTNYKLISVIFSLALLAAPAAAQQSAKSGTYKGNYWGQGVPGATQSYELEKGHVFYLAQNHGIFLNNVADGFLDKTEATCPFAGDFSNGVFTAANGYCIVTDKDGDKAFLVWRGKGPAPGTYAGTFEWAGGTGKFQGLQGNNSYHGGDIGKTGAFSAVWEGDWRLP
jgi:hypothetical protein